MALFLCTGARVSDVCRFGRQHIKDGNLYWVEAKNELRAHKQMDLPINAGLWPALDQVPKSQLTFLLNDHGKPFTPEALTMWFGRRVKEAGLTGLSAHGLRKTFLMLGIENGQTLAEAMACVGHKQPQTTMRYIEKRDLKKLASSGMAKMPTVLIGNEIGTPSAKPLAGVPKSAKKANKIKGP